MHRIALFRSSRFRACLTLLLALATVPAFAADDEVSPNLTEEERAHVVELLETSQSELEALAAEAEGDLWTERPAADSWSVGEVVEHLVLAEEMFYGIVTSTLESEPNPEWRTVAESGTAGLEATVRDRSQQFQAPEPLQPTGEPSRSDLLARFASARAGMIELVRSLDGPVKQHTFTGPPGTMNTHQWLVLVGAHTLRHNQQMKEALEAVR